MRATVLSHLSWIVPILGTRRQERLEENIGALDVELTPEDLKAIERAVSRITIHGAWYPENIERMSYL